MLVCVAAGNQQYCQAEGRYKNHNSFNMIKQTIKRVAAKLREHFR